VAEGPLAQSRFRLDRDGERPCDFECGLPRARKVAGIDGGDGFFRERLSDAPGLPKARVVEGDIELSLDAGVDIPCGFAMAHGNQAGDLHPGRF
jgi:hypothetical protein